MIMDSELSERKDFIVQYFLERGLAPKSAFEIIQYLAHSCFINPSVSVFDIKETLYNSRLPFVDLEEDIFSRLKECLVIEGRKGLEYRLGKGFSYLVHQESQL